MRWPMHSMEHNQEMIGQHTCAGIHQSPHEPHYVSSADLQSVSEALLPCSQTPSSFHRASPAASDTSAAVATV